MSAIRIFTRRSIAITFAVAFMFASTLSVRADEAGASTGETGSTPEASFAQSAAVQQPATPQPPTSLKPKQILKITVYREPDLSGSFVIDENGMIAFPLIGNISTTDKTSDQLIAEMTQSLRKFVIDPQVSLNIEHPAGAGPGKSALSSVESLTLIGEVRKPGAFEFTENLTLSKLIAESGGFTPVANTKKIKLARKTLEGQSIQYFDMDQINDGALEDPPLMASDKIIVTAEQKDSNTAAILGEVRSAGIYEVTPGFTLMKLIARAGGFTQLAATSKIRVVRQEGGDRKVYLYNASAIINGQGADPEMKAGDMVFVPESFF